MKLSISLLVVAVASSVNGFSPVVHPSVRGQMAVFSSSNEADLPYALSDVSAPPPPGPETLYEAAASAPAPPAAKKAEPVPQAPQPPAPQPPAPKPEAFYDLSNKKPVVVISDQPHPPTDLNFYYILPSYTKYPCPPENAYGKAGKPLSP